MPMAICTNGHLRHYANPRGTRLADFPPCPCGSGWKPAAFDYDLKTYVLRASGASSTKGRKRGKCPVCGKQRLQTLKRQWHSYERDSSTDKMVDVLLELPEGVQPCWYHRAEDVREALAKLEKEKKP